MSVSPSVLQHHRTFGQHQAPGPAHLYPLDNSYSSSSNYYYLHLTSWKHFALLWTSEIASARIGEEPADTRRHKPNWLETCSGVTVKHHRRFLVLVVGLTNREAAVYVDRC